MSLPTTVVIYDDTPAGVIVVEQDGLVLEVGIDLQGPKGDPGPQGPQGEDGPEGPEGPKGDTGEQGDPGGPMGPQGPQGEDRFLVEGADGYPPRPNDGDPVIFVGQTAPDDLGLGLPGDVWMQNGGSPQVNIVTSVNGLTGDVVLVPGEGPEGPQGPQGEPGVPGEPGPAGPAGPAGADGLQGAPGNPGQDGAPGVTGPQGETGPAGPTGEAGPVGPQGPAGPQGEPGDFDPTSIEQDIQTMLEAVTELDGRIDVLEAGAVSIWRGTQAAYNALGAYSDSTFYVIEEG